MHYDRMHYENFDCIDIVQKTTNLQLHPSVLSRIRPERACFRRTSACSSFLVVLHSTTKNLPNVQPSSPETSSPAIPAELADYSDRISPPPPTFARLPQCQYVPQPSLHVPFNPSSPTASESNRVISTPLDQPLTASFATRAMGEESFNGGDGA